VKNVHTAKVEEVESGIFPYGTEYRIVLLSGNFTFSAIQRCFKQSVENFVETHFLFRLFVCGHGVPCPYNFTFKIAFVTRDDVGSVPYIVTFKFLFVTWDDVGIVPYRYVNYTLLLSLMFLIMSLTRPLRFESFLIPSATLFTE